MRVIVSTEVNKGRTIKIGDLVIIGAKKATGDDAKNENSDISKSVNRHAGGRRILPRSAKNKTQSIR